MLELLELVRSPLIFSNSSISNPPGLKIGPPLLDAPDTVAPVELAAAEQPEPLPELSPAEESNIRVWLAHIEETDPAIIAEVAANAFYQDHSKPKTTNQGPLRRRTWTAMGNGRHWYWGAKNSTDAYRSIDVQRWNRDGWLAPHQSFVCQWFSQGEVASAIHVRTEPDWVIFTYRHRSGGEEWKDESYPVHLDWGHTKNSLSCECMGGVLVTNHGLHVLSGLVLPIFCFQYRQD